ncbi:MAG: hypothetical protein ACLF0P_07970 [Thermoanaerobaculia bacterium]
MDDSSVRPDTNVLPEATTPTRELRQRTPAVLNEWPNRELRLRVSGRRP